MTAGMRCTFRPATICAGLIATLVLTHTPIASAQSTCPAQYTPAEANVGAAVVSVCYRTRTATSAPVFGHSLEYDQPWQVQYDTLWNTSVILDTPEPVELAGITLDPGRYALYAVPSSFEWLVTVTTAVDAAVSGGAG